MKIKIKKMFDEYAKKFGAIAYNGIELALTQDPYPDGPFMDWYFTASAMDLDGNRWDVFWYSTPDVDECEDYASQVDDWDCPTYAEMVDEGYYLD